MAQRLRGVDKTANLGQLASIFERVELSNNLLNRKAIELSVGQQQRVAVTRALYTSLALIIADESTSALDSQTRNQFIQLLLDCANTSKVVFVSHDMSLRHI